MLVLIFILVMVAAALFGMMGLGSGIIYVPLLSWWGLDFATGAIPMGLLLSIGTGAGAAYTYARMGLVHKATGLVAASTVILGAPLGVRALHYFPVSYIKIILAATALYVATRALRSGEPHVHPHQPYILTIGLTLLVGFFMGFFSALIGVGGGFLLAPVLLARGYPVKEAVGTTALVVTICTSTAFLFHLPTADFPIRAAILLTVAALLGARLGGNWASKHANPKTIRLLVAVVIILIAIKVGGEGLIALTGNG
jgi:uncharacterized membrane protein YfcA